MAVYSDHLVFDLRNATISKGQQPVLTLLTTLTHTGVSMSYSARKTRTNVVPPHFRIAALIITLLLAGLLVYVVRLTLNTARPLSAAPTPETRVMAAATPVPSATVSNAAEAEPTSTAQATPDMAGATPNAALSEQPRQTAVPGGGFAYGTLPGFAITTGASSVTMTGPSGNAALAPIFLLSGGAEDQFVTLANDRPTDLDQLFDTFVAFFAEQDNFAVDNRQSLTIDGAPARSVELVGDQDDVPFAGRIVMAQPSAGRLFVMTGVAPLAEWQVRAADQFDTVLASVTLTTDAPATPATAVLPSPTPTASPEPTFSPAPTSIPLSRPLPTPDPNATMDATVASYGNANVVRALASTAAAVWAASEGGIAAWNHQGGAVKFSIEDGLALNHFDSVTYCPMPGLGVVFGSDGGLQIFDNRTGTWNTLNSANSAMSFDDVSALTCNVDAGILIIGYRQHGLDVFDVAQNSWTHVDRNDGLADNFVDYVAMAGDREEIWVASGFSLTTLTNQGSVIHTSGNSPLQGAPINALLSVADKSVWVVQPAALHNVRGQEWTTYSTASSPSTSAAFPQGALTAITVAPDGAIWLGSAAGEVCRFAAAAARCELLFVGEDGLPALPITSMAAFEDLVYVGTEGGGVSVYDGRRWEQRVIPGEILLDNRVHSLVEDANGFVWIVGHRGVQQLNPLDPVVAQARSYGTTDMPLDAAQSTTADFMGGVWFGGLGAAHIDEDGTWDVYTSADGLAGNVVQAIAVDPQFRVWLGTKNGLSIWNGEAFFNLTGENGLPSENILALLPQRDAMWIGSNSGGLYRFVSNQLRIFSRNDVDLPSDTITALAEAADGALLVGTDRGLVRFRNETVETIDDVPAVPVTAIAVDGDRIWVATNGDGLYVYDGRTWRRRGVNDDLPSLTVSALLVDRYGTLWIGGARGGIVREPVPAP